MLTRESMKASIELIEAYEELRSMMLCTTGRCANFFNCSTTLFANGGMAEFISCSSEVFYAKAHTVKLEENKVFSLPVICQGLKSELTDILTDIALTNLHVELNI